MSEVRTPRPALGTAPVAGSAAPAARKGAVARRRRPFARGLAVTVVVVAAVYPLVWLLLASLKTRADLAANPWGLPETWTWANFDAVLSDDRILRYFENSLLVTVAAVSFVLVLGVPAAYAIARLRLRGERLALMTFLLAEMVPVTVIVIPILLAYQWLGLDDSRVRLVVAYTVATLGFTVFVARGAFLSIPEELREAARLDGCNELQVFLRVMLPLVRGSIAVIAVFASVFIWNEYFLALILVSDADSRTLPLGLAEFQGQYTTDWPKLAAAVVVSALPTFALYVAFQRKITDRVGRAGALK